MDKLRETFDKITCDWCRLGFERLMNGMHVTFTSGVDGIARFRHENTPCTSKANELEAALRQQTLAFDKNCITLEDGSCVGENCMHDQKQQTPAAGQT